MIIYQSEAEKTSSNDVVYGGSGSSGKMTYILLYSDILGRNLGMSANNSIHACIYYCLVSVLFNIIEHVIVRDSNYEYITMDSIFKSLT